MAISSKKLIEMGWRSTQTKTGNEIILSLFPIHPGGKTQEEIRQELIKYKLKNVRESELRSRSKDSLNNIVSNYLKAFEKLNYVIKIGEKMKEEKDGTYKPVRIDKYHKNWEYALDLKFFFDYANEKLPKGKKFVYSPEEKYNWGDAWFLNYDMIEGKTRKIILKYPVENLIEKIKLYLFDAYIMHKVDSELVDEKTREKIKIIMGFLPEISKEIINS